MIVFCSTVKVSDCMMTKIEILLVYGHIYRIYRFCILLYYEIVFNRNPKCQLINEFNKFLRLWQVYLLSFRAVIGDGPYV